MMGYFGFGWGNYVSVAEKRLRAEKELAKIKKKGYRTAPVTIEGRKIAKNFWGKSWCENLERYSDFATRLPRGRSYVCNGCVVDLQVARGKVSAKVSGSKLYDVTITIAPVVTKRWQAICRDCAGSIESLIELLQGRLAKGVMERVCRGDDGLFPAPGEIKLSCTCPDWADMCKHVAATLYGVGARLDAHPQLLFVLRGVDEGELVANAGQNLAQPMAPSAAAVLDTGDVAALFGLDMAEADAAEIRAVPVATPLPRTKAEKRATAAKGSKSAKGGPSAKAGTSAKRGTSAKGRTSAKGGSYPKRGKPFVEGRAPVAGNGAPATGLKAGSARGAKTPVKNLQRRGRAKTPERPAAG